MGSRANILAPLEYSILLLGLDNAGKTTLLNTIKSLYAPPPSEPSNIPNPWVSTHEGSDGDAPLVAPKQTVPTVGQNVSLIDLDDMYMKIWDVGGQHSLRKLWKSYYASCHAIIFVIDSTDVGDGVGGVNEGSYISGSTQQHNPTNVNDEDGSSSSHAGRLNEARLVLESILAESTTQGIPILILANKQDREDCVETVRIKEGVVRPVFEGAQGGVVRDSRVLPISALTGIGVREAVEWVRVRVVRNREGRSPGRR